MRVVYSVYGDDLHFNELKRSAESVLKWHPNAEILCFTTPDGVSKLSNFPGNVECIHDVVPRSVPWHDPCFKVTAINRAKGKPFLFLDNDTFVIDQLSPAFELLPYYDLLAVHAPVTDQRVAKKYPKIKETSHIPEAFSEINTGVLFISDSQKAHDLIERWHDLLKLNPDELGDQWRMRIALFDIMPKMGVLTNVYNYRLNMRQAVFGKIKIIHGRRSNILDIADRLNKVDFYRHVILKNNEIYLEG